MTGHRKKQGSYLVEAVLTLPFCILAVVALTLVIRIIAICETIGFVSANEMKEACLQNSTALNVVSLCHEIESGVMEECRNLTEFRIKDLDYLHSKAGMDDLIGVDSQAEFRVENPVGFLGEIQFSCRILARSFTGTLQDAAPLEASAFTDGSPSVPVAVYPKYGEKYHRMGCTIVQREDSLENKGTEMDRQDAIRKGYEPCRLCGGS